MAPKKGEKQQLVTNEPVVVRQPRSRKLKLTVCSSSAESTVDGLIEKLKTLTNVVSQVEFQRLPYNVSDLNNVKFSGIEVMVLCHSIENRRLSLTNVTDSLYDAFLKKANKNLKKKNVIVIAHDFEEADMEPDKAQARMEAFKNNQRTAVDTSSLVLFCGKLGKGDCSLTDTQLGDISMVLGPLVSTTDDSTTMYCPWDCCYNENEI